MLGAPDYRVRGASSDDDLRQILALQSANLKDALTSDQRREQGFVTLKHDLSLLREMNQPWPHVIATPADSGEVVAYALVMLHEFRPRFPLLEPMFERLDHIEYRGRPFSTYRSYVMGQICVAATHRGRRLVEKLYAGHKQRMSPHFDLLVTVIDGANPRSLRAHEKAGFEVLDQYRTEVVHEWVIVGLDLRPGP